MIEELKRISKDFEHKRKITAKFLKNELQTRNYPTIPISTVKWILRTYMNKSWQKVTTRKLVHENDHA